MDRLTAAVSSLVGWTTQTPVVPLAQQTQPSAINGEQREGDTLSDDWDNIDRAMLEDGSDSTTPTDQHLPPTVSSHQEGSTTGVDLTSTGSHSSSTGGTNDALTPPPLSLTSESAGAPKTSEQPSQSSSSTVASTSSAATVTRTGLYAGDILNNPFVPKNVQAALKILEEKFAQGQKLDRDALKAIITLIAKANLTPDQKQILADPVLRIGQEAGQLEDPLSQAKAKQIRAKIRELGIRNIETDLNKLFAKSVTEVPDKKDEKNKRK